MKPRIRKERGTWACWSPCATGFIVGRGSSALAAWNNWQAQVMAASSRDELADMVRAGKGAQA